MTTKRRQGLSLLEMSVACSMFLAMVLVMLGLLSQNRRVSQKAMGHTDATTESMLLVEKVRLEMRNSRVIGTDGTARLLYWRARLQNGLPQLDPQGHVDWLPGWPADPDLAQLVVTAQGNLQRTFQGTRQTLCSLGASGRLDFLYNASFSNLTLVGEVGNKDLFDPVRNNIQPFVYQIYLGNSE